MAVDGIALTGRTYEQIVRMIRGDIGQPVTLKVNGAQGIREVAVPRVAKETLMGKKRN